MHQLVLLQLPGMAIIVSPLLTPVLEFTVKLVSTAAWLALTTMGTEKLLRPLLKVRSVGTPFAALSANTRTAQPGRELRITAGRLMSERTRILDDYRRQIVLMVTGASVKARVGALPYLAAIGQPSAALWLMMP